MVPSHRSSDRFVVVVVVFVELLILPTAKAIKALEKDRDQTNAILHVTC